MSSKNKGQKRNLTDSAEVYAVFGSVPYYMRAQPQAVKTRDLSHTSSPERIHQLEDEQKTIDMAQTDERWRHHSATRTFKLTGELNNTNSNKNETKSDLSEKNQTPPHVTFK